MTSHIKAIIFDFGAVLVEWEPRNIFRNYFPDNASIDAFLQEIDFKQWNVEQDKGRSFAEGTHLLAQKFPQHKEVFHALQERWGESIVGEIEGTVQLLHALKAKGYPIYGLSNWSAETFPIARARYEFFELFDDMVISGEVKLIKPEPAIFEYCLQKIGRPSYECLFIDDSELNIISATKLGFDCIHFRSPQQLKEELQKRELL